MRQPCVGVDIKASAFTQKVGSITDRRFVKRCLPGVHAVVHTATLHKPHVASHTRQDFVDTNVTGTLNLLEEATAAGVGAFVFTSTTSVFGHASTPPLPGPAAWITEDVVPAPRNIYGVTKVAAENLCELFHATKALPCIVLRTSRFFLVRAHLLALEKVPAIGFGRYIVSATTPFTREDLQELRINAAAVVRRRVPRYEDVYARRGWSMFPGIDRVYINERARRALGWEPKYDFALVLDRVRGGEDSRSPLAREVGSKEYHPDTFEDGPYPVE